MRLAHIAKHLFGPDHSCSDQTAKMSNPSLNSTSAPSKHSTHRKGTPPFSPLPGSSFEFQMTYSDVPVGTATSCPSSSGLGITWPGAGATANLPYTATVCGGGVVHVSRVFAG